MTATASRSRFEMLPLRPHLRYCTESHVDPVLHDPLVRPPGLDWLVFGLTRSAQVGTRAVVSGGRSITQILSTSTWIDNFNDQDLAEYSGDTGEFGFTTTTTREGQAALVTEFSATGFNKIQSLSGNGLDNYFPKGNTAQIYAQSNEATTGGDVLRQVMDYGMVDADNYYEIALRWDLDEAYLRTVVDGGFGDIDSVVDVGWAPDSWFRIDITWDDGTLGGADNDHTIDIVEVSTGNVLSTLSGNNNDHATGDGVAIAARINTTTDTRYVWEAWERNP